MFQDPFIQIDDVELLTAAFERPTVLRGLLRLSSGGPSGGFNYWAMSDSLAKHDRCNFRANNPSAVACTPFTPYAT